MNGTLIAIEGIASADVYTHGMDLLRHFMQRAVPAVLAPQDRAESTGPLVERAAGRMALVRDRLIQGETVIAAPFLASAAAYRRAAGLFDAEDAIAEHTWEQMGLQPHLTVLVDRLPVSTGAHHGARSMAYHGSAREHLLRAAGWNRETWVVIPGGDRQEAAVAIRQHADDLIARRQPKRWPLDNGWRVPRQREA